MTTSHKTLLTICGLLLIVIGFRTWLGFRSQPQLPPSPEVFTTVDALFTAVTAHDQQRLTACEQRLEKFKAAGSLPTLAAKRLDGVISTARAGQWESAAKRLYDFMHGQRRDTPAAHAPSGQTAMNSK
jgi:hypothetical protein